MDPYASPQSHSASRQDYTAQSQAPNIQLQQATPNAAQVPSTPSSSQSQVPNVLQPGSHRQSVSYQAPPTVPTMPTINTTAQQYTPSSSRPNITSSHSHSRSSPAGLDQKYIPFSSTTPTGASSNPFSPHTPSIGTSHSPLGLSDIRPRGLSDYNNESFGTMTNSYDYTPQQTKSNYLAPWATYAFDWCKWPVQNGNSCGKMAVGSYLEDPHNFVSRFGNCHLHLTLILESTDSNHRHTDCVPGQRTARRSKLWLGFRQGCRSHLRIPCHSHFLGASINLQTIHRPACYIG